MNPRRRRLMILLLTVVPVVAFLIAAVVYLVVQVRGVVERLDVILVDELSRQTGRAVEVRKVEVSPLGVATVHGLRIANGRTFQAGALIEARRVIVVYRWLDLVTGRVAAVQSVRSVRLIGPKILIERFRTGRLNIQDLIRPRPPGPPFTGDIRIVEGSVTFKDWLAAMPAPRPAVTTAVDVTGTFDAASTPFYVYNFTGRSPRAGRFDTLAASGSIDTARSRLSVDLRVGNADAAYWSRYFVTPDAVTMLGGRADVRLSATRRVVNKRRQWSYAGAADLRDGRARVRGFRRPAANLRGTVGLADSIFEIGLSGDMAGTPFRLAGTVEGLREPRLALRVSSRSVDFARVLGAIERQGLLERVSMSGRGTLVLDIFGPSGDLAYSVRTSIPSASAYGYRAAEIDARATYARGLVDLERATAHALGGRIQVAGAIQLRRNVIALLISGTATRIELAMLPELREAGLRGTATADFDLTGTLERPRLEADIRVPSGLFSTLVFRNAAARVAVNRDAVRIGRLAAGAAGGIVRLSGTVAAGRLDLNAVAVGVDLAQVGRMLGLTGYAGITNFRGRITGTPSNPVASGQAEIFEGGFQRFEFDYARGRLVATRSAIELEDAVVHVLPAEVSLRGRVAGIGTRAPTVELELEVADAPAARILSLLEIQGRVSGRVSARLTVRGAGRDIDAEGTLTLTDGTVAGYPVASATAHVSYSRGSLRMSEITARSNGTTIAAEGTIDERGRLAFEFTADDVELVQLSQWTRAYAALSGTADVSGRVGGTTDTPTVAVSFSSTRPIINTVEFRELAAELAWDGTNLRATNVSLRAAQGELLIELATYNSDQKTLQVAGGRLSDFPLESAYAVVAESPYVDQPEAEGLRGLLTRVRHPERGVISASFVASGPLDEIEASTEVSMRELEVGGIRDIRVDLAATSRRGLVVLDRFEASDDSLNVTARGTLVADGRTDLEIDAYNLDLVTLLPVTGPVPVSGTATLRASVQGPVKAPLVTASVEIVEPEIYGIKLDRLRASQIEIDQDSIDITRVLVTRDEHSASLYGTLPWSWATLAVPADRPIDLHASMEQQTLKILAVLSDSLIAERTEGQLSARLDMTGTLSDPDLGGRMTVVDGKVGIRHITTDFTNVQADLTFDQDVARVARLEGGSSGGGRFEVVPGGTISLRNVIRPVPGQPRGAMNLTVLAKDLAISAEDLFGYRERISGTFTTAGDGITAVGSLGQPLISGRVDVANATALLSPVPEAALPPRRPLLVDPRFDLAFALHDNVWFRNPSIVALLGGQGHVTGSLARPNLAAKLQVERGTLRLPTQRMRITKGDIEISWTPEESRAVVDLQARTSVTALSPTGERRRYTIVMSVRGPLEDLRSENVDLRSEPPGLSRTQILAALGHFEDIFGTGEAQLSEQLRGIFTLAVSPAVFGPLESAFIEALGLEEFAIEYGFEQPLAVFLSRRLFDDFYVSYWRIVTAAPSITGITYSLRFGYRVRDWLDIGWITDSRRINIIEAAYRRRF